MIDGSSKLTMFGSGNNSFDINVNDALNEMPKENPSLEAITLSIDSVDTRKPWNSLDGPKILDIIQHTEAKQTFYVIV